MNGSLRYSKEHVWIKVLGQDRIKLGISLFAKQRLGEIICIEWPQEGDNVREFQSIGTLESAKTVVDLYSPVDGLVIEVNPSLKQDISIINVFPLSMGWIVDLRVSNLQQVNRLLTEEEYQTWIYKEE